MLLNLEECLENPGHCVVSQPTHRNEMELIFRRWANGERSGTDSRDSKFSDRLIIQASLKDESTYLLPLGVFLLLVLLVLLFMLL